MIRLMVTKMGGSVEDAKDVFQDGLIIMLEKIDNNDKYVYSRHSFTVSVKIFGKQSW